MKKEEEFAFVIPGPAEHLTLKIRRSANAWWMDGVKLHKFVNAVDNMVPIREAIETAGITPRQYKYFKKLHPVITDRARRPYDAVSMLAKVTIINAINNGDVKMAAKWLEWTQPEVFSLRRRRTPLQDLRRKNGFPTGEDHRYPGTDDPIALAHKMQEDIRKLEIELQNITD